jgi:hypothetical protein
MSFEDSLIEETEPTFCALRPHAFVQIIRQMAREATAREGVALQSLLWGLSGHELILSEKELAALRRAWERLATSEQIWERSDVHIEAGLVGALLLGLRPAAQFQLLLKRPATASDRLAFESLFGWPPDWADVREVLDGPKSALTLRRALWFIAMRPREIPTEIAERIAPLWTHEDSLVRASVLKIILEAGSPEQVRLVVDGGWISGHPEERFLENHWGTWLLIDRADWLPLDEIVKRIPASFRAEAVERRGNGLQDYLSYARWLDEALLPHGSLPILVRLGRDEGRSRRDPFRPGAYPLEGPSRILHSRSSTWGDAAAATAQDYKEGFDLAAREKEAAERLKSAQETAATERKRNLGLIDAPSRNVLEMISVALPALAEEWFGMALSDQTADRARAGSQPAFFQDFCAVLMKSSPARGVQLYKRLKTLPGHAVVDSSTQVAILDFALWAAPDCPDISTLRREVLTAATTDAELSQMAFAAEYGGNRLALEILIRDLRISPRLLDQARARALEHLLSMPQQEGAESADDETFLGEVEHAASRWSRWNRYAMHWYRQALLANSKVQAWAGFRLMLRCVDKRFWLWCGEIEREIGDRCPPTRLKFLKTQKYLIERAAKARDKKLEGSLVGFKILDRATWPWMGVPETLPVRQEVSSQEPPQV